MKPMRHFAFVSLLMLSVGLGLSLTGWQGQRAEATAKLPSSIRDAAATFTVSTVNDSGDGSLRKAIQDANAMAGDDTITFATPFFSTPRTITLTSGELAINSNLTINGPGANLLTISGNNASRVFNLGSGFTVSLSGMTITGGNASNGGGIRNSGTLTVTNSTISGNTAALSGGGIFNNGTLTVTNSTVSGNTATDIGGGITNSGTLTVTNSTISGNTAALGGGGILNTGSGTLTVTNSTISGNTANGEGGRGGGIENFGNLTVTNSTISGNRVPNGDNNGGGILTFVTATITSSTITNNSAAGANSAGGVVRNSGTVTIRSSIIAGNVNNANQPDVVSSANPGGFTITSSGFNLIGNRGAVVFSQPGDQSGGAGVPVLNPLLGPLQNNGGATPTHALLGGSPALNAGNAFGSTTDQRGVPRVSGASADIGAVEMQALIVTNTTDSLGAGTLRQAITTANDNGPGLDDILFDNTVFNTPRTITLTSGELSNSSNLTINGPGAKLLTISGNNASRVFTINGNVTVTLIGLTITGGNGRASFANGNGGGIFNNNGNLTVSHCHIIGNTAQGLGGGGLGTFGGTINVTHSTINGNSAGLGGGLSAQDANVSLTNSTISGNMGGGGGIFNFSSGGNSRLEVANCTIANNNAPVNSTGGILTRSQNAEASTTTTLRNTIIAGNTPNNLATATSGGSTAMITSLGFNLTGDNSLEFINQSTDFVNTDPLLGPLQDNGGTTPTHALRFGSRALDAGHSSGAMTDQRGLPRRFDITTINNEPDSDGADIGAYEAQAAPVQVTPTLAISNVSKAEGNSGMTAFDFTVTLSEDSTQTVTVDYLSGGGTATVGSDYARAEGRLTFTPGQTTRTITVQVNGDTTVEPDETFLVELRSPSNATLADGQGQGTIVNDDVPSLIVQNTDNNGNGSLRQVIADIPAGGIVTFSPTVFNVARTITLASEIQITKNLTINGTGANMLTISVNNVTRVLRVLGSGLNVTLNDLTIANGNANGSFGGGILSNGALTLNRCVIANNKATTSGGGVHLQAGASGTFTACTFNGNSAASGGALYFEGGAAQELKLTNCTISGNTATQIGGALLHQGMSGASTTQINSCTIANNESADTGGILISATGAGVTATATTRNSIYANNTNTNLRAAGTSGATATLTSQGHNLTTGAGSGLLTAEGDQLNTNPLLGPLQNNGGTTPTRALLAGSPAQDKGQSSGLMTDQRDNQRPFDDLALQNASGGNGADIGAFEQGQQIFPVSAANYTVPVAPESIVAVFGANLSNGIAVAGTIPLPTSLNEASFTVRDSLGVERLAPLFFVSPGQVNLQIPPGTAQGAATIFARRNGSATTGATFMINAVEPGLFTANATGTGAPAGSLFRIAANGAQSFEPLARVVNGVIEPAPINLGPAGDQVFLIFYGTGIRNGGPTGFGVSFNVGGVTRVEGVAGAAPGFIGLDQTNSFALPRLLLGRGSLQVTMTADGKVSNPVTIIVQ